MVRIADGCIQGRQMFKIRHKFPSGLTRVGWCAAQAGEECAMAYGWRFWPALFAATMATSKGQMKVAHNAQE
jgi:hypothetical protein